MEKPATSGVGVHLHTLKIAKRKRYYERGWWSRTRSDSDRGGFRSKRRTTAPPCSTHVQPGDVSSFLILQGGGEVEGELRQHDGMVAVELVALRQSFAKHYGGGGGVGEGRATPGARVRLPSHPPLFIGGRGEGPAPLRSI